MADIAQVVDEARGFLLSYDQSMSEELAELAANYASLCVESNKRLARCQRLLQQGLRAEGIHLSKEPPDLLDSIQALDFPERAAWIELTRQYDLASPPEFDATAIEFLHAAHVEDSPLRELVRSHRRLALQRAPLQKRLQVLRELAAKDPDSPIWPADIQIFEAARLDQIKVEAAEAKRLQDIAALGILNDELSSKAWSSPPPKPLARDVAQTLAHLRSLRRRQGQVELIVELHDAFAALDVDKGREMRNRWRLIDGDSNRAENPLYTQVEPVFLWLEERDREDAEEDRYYQSLADLTQAVEQGAARADLERTHEALVQAGRGVPDELERGYRARIEVFSRRAARKTRIIAACSASIAAGLLLVAMLVQRQRAGEAAAREIAARLEKSVAADRLFEAREVLNKLSDERSGFLLHPAVVAEAARLASKEAAEKKRVEGFEAIFRRAGDEPVAANEPASLASARDLAVTADEKRRVEALADRRLRDFRDALARVDSDARPILDRLDSLLARIEDLLKDRDSAEEARDSLSKVAADLRELDSRVGGAGEATRRRFAEVSARSDKVRAALKIRDDALGAERDITRATMTLPGDPEGYAKALADSIARVPASPRTASFRVVLDEKPTWAGALALVQFGRHSKLMPNGAEKPAAALAKAAECEKLLADHPRMPDRGVVEELRDHYRAIALRTEGADNLRQQIGDLLGEQVIADVFATTVKDAGYDMTYYSKEPIDPSNGRIKWMASYKPGEVRTDFVPKGLAIIPASVAAPQSRLAASLKESLGKRKDLEGWDSMMVNFLKTIAEDPSVDPILKYVMIRRLAGIARDGSRPLASGLEPLFKAIKNPGVPDGLRWMNPTDPDANNARPKAREVIKGLGPVWAEVVSKADFAHRSLGEKYARIPQPIGWLIKEDSWTCRPIPTLPLPASGELCVVSGTSRAEWEPVGTLRNQGFAFLPQKAGKLVEGRLVFARPKAGLGSGEQ